MDRAGLIDLQRKYERCGWSMTLAELSAMLDSSKSKRGSHVEYKTRSTGNTGRAQTSMTPAQDDIGLVLKRLQRIERVLQNTSDRRQLARRTF